MLRTSIEKNKSERLPKPLIALFACISVWQMVVIWNGSLSGFISDFSIIDMPISLNLSYISYFGLIIGAILSVIFPNKCLNFCRIIGILAFISIILCFFPIKGLLLNLVYISISLCAPLLTANYVAYMIFSFDLKDIWFEMLCEILFVAVASIILLNGLYIVPYYVFNILSLIMVGLCTMSYFLLKDKEISFYNEPSKEPPKLLFALMYFFIYAVTFLISVTSVLSYNTANAKIYLNLGQLVVLVLIIILNYKKFTIYNLLSVCSFLIISGFVFLLFNKTDFIGYFFLGTATAVSYFTMYISGIAFSKYKSRFIPMLMIIVSSVSAGTSDILYKAMSGYPTYFYLVLIGLAIIFITILQAISPFFQYKYKLGKKEPANKCPESVAEYIENIDIEKKVETEKGISSRATDILTAREKEIVILVLSGYTGTQIALELFISLSTVKTHMKNIYLKLEINSRKELFEIYHNLT